MYSNVCSINCIHGYHYNYMWWDIYIFLNLKTYQFESSWLAPLPLRQVAALLREEDMKVKILEDDDEHYRLLVDEIFKYEDADRDSYISFPEYQVGTHPDVWETAYNFSNSEGVMVRSFDPYVKPIGSIWWRDPFVNSVGSIWWRDPYVNSVGSIWWPDPYVNSVGSIWWPHDPYDISVGSIWWPHDPYVKPISSIWWSHYPYIWLLSMWPCDHCKCDPWPLCDPVIYMTPWSRCDLMTPYNLLTPVRPFLWSYLLMVHNNIHMTIMCYVMTPKF